jgi:hypothetical protein
MSDLNNLIYLNSPHKSLHDTIKHRLQTSLESLDYDWTMERLVLRFNQSAAKDCRLVATPVLIIFSKINSKTDSLNHEEIRVCFFLKKIYVLYYMKQYSLCFTL